MEFFNESLFDEHLRTRWLGRYRSFVDEIDSTNLWMKKASKPDSPHGMLLCSAYQRSGKGQYARTWQSDKGKNLLFSVLFRPIKHDRINLISLLAAYSVVQVINKLDAAVPIRIKWPNDIIAGERKLGGILLENVFQGSAIERVVLGIGLNVEEQVFPEELRDKAIALSSIVKDKPPKEVLLAQVLNELELHYDRWVMGDTELSKKINQNLIGFAHQAILEIDGVTAPYPFRILGVDEQGYLMALTSDYNVKTFRHEQVRIERLVD